jgi:serine/threonine-protein kinase RsbW
MPALRRPPGSIGNSVIEEIADGWSSVSLSTTDQTGSLLDEVTAAMRSLGYREEDIFGVRLALEEALVNAIKHGHKYDPSKRVTVRYRIRPEHVLVDVEDQGPGFDPSGVPDPTAPENLERASGRGLLLMRCYTSWLRHNKRGNRVLLCKYASGRFQRDEGDES